MRRREFIMPLGGVIVSITTPATAAVKATTGNRVAEVP